jgi:protein gp37
MDFYELNNADMTKIDDMREFRNQFYSSPFYGRYKIYVFDECHRMSKGTQNMLLKEVEDTHPGNYFIFCSTEFDNIIEPLRNRCMPIEFKTVERVELRRLIEDVCKWERIRYQDDVLDSIVEEAKGMPRNALTLLQKFVEMEKVEKMKVGKVQSLDREDGSNILFVAPHGVYHDDDNSDLLSKQLADHLDGYAVINTKYQKPETVGLTKLDIKNNLANLSRWEHVDDDKIKNEFLNPISEFRAKIIKDHGEGLIFQIHGISDDHIHKVANIIPGYKTKPESLHILIGYGQGSGQLTADEDQIIKPLIKCLKRKGINAAIAPPTAVVGSDGTLNSKSVNSAHKNVKAISENPDILIQNTKPAFNKTTESIEWAAWTWNPVTGCKAGCKYCYARSMTKRFPEKFPNGFEPTFYPKRLEAPANTSVPKSNHIGDRNVFVVSMGDLFGDWVKQEWIDAVLDAVRTDPQWNYLFLTKNPKRLMNIEWPDNAWIGTTVDCQARVKPAEEAFEKITAKVKFLSCEPLSEEITFTNLTLFDWVIVGARSKTTQLPEMQPKSEWVKSLMLQAWDAGCKVYCKPNLKAGVKEYPLAEAIDNT